MSLLSEYIRNTCFYVPVGKTINLHVALFGCLLLVLGFILMQSGILNETLRQRRCSFRDIMFNASKTRYPCQRKFWNGVNLLSALGINSMIEKNASATKTTAPEKRGMKDKSSVSFSYITEGLKHGFRRRNISEAPSPESFAGEIIHAPVGFEEALRMSAAHGNRTVVVSIVDKTYVQFALNFYETSILKFGISNFFLVCLDRDAEIWLKEFNMECYYYDISILTRGVDMKRGDFGTSAYYLKTNIKTLIVLQAIKLSYTVLVVDLDIVFLKNPFPYLTCSECDIHIQQDRVHLNSGFVYVRPTNKSIALYETAWQQYNRYKKSHDQAYINMAVQMFAQNKKAIMIHRLSHQEFPCGAYYFTTTTTVRAFGNDPCKECVIVHNNYIGSAAAKRYRFRENLLWVVDRDGYYSNPQTRYIIYSNPYYFGHETWVMEIGALRSALAIALITKRVLVLPKFHCCDCKRKRCEAERHRCSLLSVLKLRTFDEVFKGKYREHTFANNPKVSSALRSLLDSKKATSFIIQANIYQNVSHDSIRERILLSQNSTSGASDGEVRAWFGENHEPVIHFHSMYGAFGSFASLDQNIEFNKKIKQAFVCTNYGQWEVDPWL